MAMRGWRRIGIIVSVIWFFGFGVFLWNRFVEDAVAPYAQDLQICSAIEQYSDDFWQANARNSEELSEKLQANQDQYEKCASKAKLQWESERPSDSVLAVTVLVIDLVTIALGWLIVWGLLSVVGFTAGLQRPENSGGARWLSSRMLPIDPLMLRVAAQARSACAVDRPLRS